MITVLTIIGKLLEDSRKIGLAPRGAGRRLANIAGMYECFNCHLTLSLGILGLVWSTSGDFSVAIVVIILILIGITSKGVFSEHKPDRLSMKDLDARYGFYVPNACALAALLFVLGTIAVGTPSAAPTPNNKIPANSSPVQKTS